MAPPPAASAPMPLPSRGQAVGFWLRSRGLMLQRLWRDTFVQPVRRWPADNALRDAPVLAEHRSALWRDGRTDGEFGLVAGKVQNLRQAVRAFHGVEVAAGEALSFWRQLGRLRARRGFVLGREVREGCVVPSLGGGLCQLSNALATCAARAGFTLVERHGHTRRIEQAPGTEADAVDATVFWNYVDLRVQAGTTWRLEVELTADELVVRLRGRRVPARPPAVPGTPVPITLRAPAPPPEAARGCLTCEQTRCFRHRETWPVPAQGRTALLLDAWTPEFEAHGRSITGGIDVFVPRAPSLLGVPMPGRSGWTWPAPQVTAWAVFFWRSGWSRWHARRPGRRQAAVVQGQHALARAYARRLRPEHVQLVVDQALLVPLWLGGHLAGRRYEVLMHSLPMREIHARLQSASQRWPDDATLRDFRADEAWLDAEEQALRHAAALVTPHRDVARVMQADIPSQRPAPLRTLPWVLPAIAPEADGPTEERPRTKPGPIVFGASALGRKGLHELAAALQGWPGELWVLGSAAGDPGAWQGLRVRPVPFRSPWWRSAAVLVLPAHVEHAPRAALKALAAGVPVVASKACGIDGLPGVHTVDAGDIAGLRLALARWTGESAEAAPAAVNPAA